MKKVLLDPLPPPLEVFNKIFKKLTRKPPYLGQKARYEKNKTTLLSQTFKVGESKVPLFFGFEASFSKYQLFLLILCKKYFSAILMIKIWEKNVFHNLKEI